MTAAVWDRVMRAMGKDAMGRAKLPVDFFTDIYSEVRSASNIY